MSLTRFKELFDILELIVRRKIIIQELFPDKEYRQSELTKKIGVASSNLSRYIGKLEENGVVEIRTSINERGQAIRIITLSRKTINIIEASTKTVLAGKPRLEDFNSLIVFLEGLMVPSLQEYSKDSIQLLSNQYTIPVDSEYFEFLRDNLMRDELKNARLVLLKSSNNIVEGMSKEEKDRVLEIIGPTLQMLLEMELPSGLERETTLLLKELGVYDLTYSELEEQYISRIKEHKPLQLLRQLILQNHRDKIPRLRANLIKLHPELDEKARSILDIEFPHLR